jgi:hypothetical protein
MLAQVSLIDSSLWGVYRNPVDTSTIFVSSNAVIVSGDNDASLTP